MCLDTCHVWDGGYNIAGDLDGVLEEFDRVIGLDRLRAIHLNDSKNPLGAHKDRHAPIGEGCIGFDALAAVTNHPALRDLPFFLETPQDDLSGWGREIAALRQRMPSSCRVKSRRSTRIRTAAAGGQHEQVKNRVHVTHLFEDVEHGAHGIADAAGNQEPEACGASSANSVGMKNTMDQPSAT